METESSYVKQMKWRKSREDYLSFASLKVCYCDETKEDVKGLTDKVTSAFKPFDWEAHSLNQLGQKWVPET
jgi:hypothetical protein